MCHHCHCTKSAEGELLTASAYFRLLHQGMCPVSLLYILTKNMSSCRTEHLCIPSFLLWVHHCMLANYSLLPNLLSLNLLDYDGWGILQTKGNATANQNLGSLEQTIQQECDSKEWRCWGEIVARSGGSRWSSSSLAVPRVISSQENILTHHLKQFSGLWVMNRRSFSN